MACKVPFKNSKSKSPFKAFIVKFVVRPPGLPSGPIGPIEPRGPILPCIPIGPVGPIGPIG